MKDFFILKLRTRKKISLYFYNLMLIIGIIFFFPYGPNSETSRVLFWLAFTVIYFINSKYFLFFLDKIIVLENEVIFVRKILKEIKVEKTDVKSIKVTFGGFFEIRTSKIKIVGLCDFDGFSRFVEDIRRTNTDLITKGC